jgi:CHRD domain
VAIETPCELLNRYEIGHVPSGNNRYALMHLEVVPVNIRSLSIRTLFTLVPAAAALTLVTATSAAAAGPAPHTQHASSTIVATVMTGQQETPPADLDGIGVAAFEINPASGTICYQIAVAHLDGQVTAAHIHKAPPGVAGPIVVPLTPPVNGFVNACTTAAPALAADIAAHPGAYYANVHTTVFPAGAVRGQLHG